MDEVALQNEMIRQFDAGIAKVKYELQKNLNDIDPLDIEKLEQMLSVFNQRLILFQHDYLNYVSQTRGKAGSNVNTFNVNTPPLNKIPELAAALMAGGAGSWVFALITITVPGGWMASATTTTLAASVGTALGVTGTVVTAGVGAIIGLGVGLGTNYILKSKRRSYRRKFISDKFDNEIVPKLRDWAVSQIRG